MPNSLVTVQRVWPTEKRMAQAQKLQSLCVFCGSQTGSRWEYTRDARALGRALAERNIRLVYGGGSVGLMNEVSRACKDAGGSVLGVIPKSLVDKEVCGGLGTPTSKFEVNVVDDMAERKTKLADASEAFVALPGGFGTLDELLEMLTWSQIGLHSKLVGLLNTNAFWSGFTSFIDHANSEGFIPGNSRELLLLDDSPVSLVDRLASLEPPSSYVDELKRAAANGDGHSD